MFGKFFASAFTGSMVGSGPDVFAVWGYIIAHTGPDSTVELNPTLVATQIGMSIERVTKALDFLSDVDPRSRSKKADGRRIIRVGEFLYDVPNHAHYRSILDNEKRKAANREYQRKSRAKKRQPQCQVSATMSAQAEAEAEEEAEEDSREILTNLPVDKSTANGLDKALEEQIIAAYHERLPQLPKVKTWNSRRRAKLLARVRQRRAKGSDTIDYWRRLFDKIGQSDYLCGEKTDWRCPGLEWILTLRNFDKIIEGAYDNVENRRG